MKDYNQEYFFLRSRGANIPVLEYGGSHPIANSHLLLSKDAIDNKLIIPLIYSKPFVKNAQLADVNFIGFHEVISERFKEHLDKIKLENIQFVPVTIQDYDNEIHKRYYLLHVHHVIRCADLGKSKWRSSSLYPDEVVSFKKLVLDNEVLDKIPEENRLIIALEEQNLYHIYHRTIVDHILQSHPTGVAFYPLAGCINRESFEDEFLDYIITD